jgi:hypothetical protein
MGVRIVLIVLTALAARQVFACNPGAPVPPIMEDHGYDRIAMEYLIDNAQSVAIGRYTGRLDIVVEGDEAGGQRRFLFELTDGWKVVMPRRQVISDYWIPCPLEFRIGSHYLMYFTAGRPLYLLSAREADPEFDALGDFDWFYNQRGELIRPELVREVGEQSAKEAGTVD